MTNGAPNSKPRMLHRILNFLLMLFNVHLAFAFYSILDLSRRWHIGVSPEKGDYERPALADFFLRKEFIVIPILLVFYMIVKEFRIRSFKKRVHINLLISAGILSHALFIGAVPFMFSLI